MQKSIKFLRKPPKRIILNGRCYTPYLIGSIPNKFGFKFDAEEETEGYSEWFNYKGLTYIQTPIND
jgi:hypothetical protein